MWGKLSWLARTHFHRLTSDIFYYFGIIVNSQLQMTVRTWQTMNIGLLKLQAKSDDMHMVPITCIQTDTDQM
jgi:hypothetical protein